jgi:hypothetical protein
MIDLIIKKGDFMAVKAKTINNNKKTLKENKKLTSIKSDNIVVEPIVLDQFFNVHTRQYHPLTHRFVENQCVLLKDWADLEDSINIYDYFNTQGYSPVIFYKWCQRFPELSEIHDYAIRKLGSRREMGAMTRKYDASTVHRTLGYYHHIWRQETAALAKLKEDASSHETKIVVIEKFSEKTPEEVAWSVHKSTANKRDYAPLGERKKE